MKGEILAVGTELLLGQIVNTNARFLAEALSGIGIDVYFQTVVGDNPDRLESALKTAFSRADCVVMTGGLGPTKDDLTKETVARYFGLPLERHEESERRIQEYFYKTGRKMSENNLKQALMPKGCIVLQNDNGTAPGCIIEKDGKVAVMLPGPPREMQPMFSKYAAPRLAKYSTGGIYSRVLKVFGIGESSAEHMLSDIIEKQTNPTIAPYAKEGEVEFRISAKCASQEEADALLEPVERHIRGRLGQAVYSSSGQTLQEVVVKGLAEHKLKLALAESCTGGMAGSMVTEVPGASDVFLCGFVTYSNTAKQKLLGVKSETLASYGAVSSQTAVEMALGAKAASGADIAVSITGIAGPGGGTEQKPVGLVYIGMATGAGTQFRELRLSGDRARIRRMSAMHALNLVRLELLKLK